MRWTLKPKPEENKVKDLAKVLNTSETIAYLLVQREIENYEDAKSFFRPSLKDLHNPFLMKDMDKAVSRIEKAITQKENILIYGDYDVDGTTSVALMATFLEDFSENIITYIPDRYKEGYGISFAGIDYAAKNKIDLIIALDCGIKAIEKVEYAKEKNIDFIICDHHQPDEKIPDAIAVLNPKRPDCEYPFKELCGCGVGFKLIQAFTQNRKESFDKLIPYLDLVVTAIGADIVPIIGENRILAYHGLKVINSKPRIGFQAIITQTKKKELNITDVVFIIAPRINAAGRMNHALKAVDLLRENNPKKAKMLAKEIEIFNKNRKETDKKITAEALLQIKKNKEENHFSTVVFNPDWHKGVIGIVASRLTEDYYRPTLVFTESGNFLTASARSVKGFNIYNALLKCKDFIEQFGGHKYAAGLSIKKSNYKKFKEKFEEVVSSTIDEKLLKPEIRIDKKINLAKITPKFYYTLKQFAPFGPGNMRPVFLSEEVNFYKNPKPIGKEKKHLKCFFQVKDISTPLNAIGFNLGEKCTSIAGKSCDIVYSLDENTWNKKTTLQLKLRDLR